MDYSPYIKEIRELVWLAGVDLNKPITHMSVIAINNILEQVEREVLMATIISNAIVGLPVICERCLKEQSRRDYYRLYYMRKVKTNPLLLKKRRERANRKLTKSSTDSQHKHSSR